MILIVCLYQAIYLSPVLGAIWSTDLLVPNGYDAIDRQGSSDLSGTGYTYGTDLLTSPIATGVLYGFRFYSPIAGDAVGLQVWRHYIGDMYEVIASVTVDPTDTGVTDVFLENPVQVWTEDYIGISYEFWNPIPYTGDDVYCGMIMRHLSNGRPDNDIGNIYTFESTVYCRTFSAQAIIEQYENTNDCELIHIVNDNTDYFLQSHDGYGLLNYDNNVDKCWRIRAAQENHVMALQSLHFIIEVTGQCSYDRVHIYRHSYERNPFHQYGVCSNSQENNWYWSIDADIIYVRFTTDGSVTYDGFEMSFRSFDEDAHDEFSPGDYTYSAYSPWSWSNPDVTTQSPSREKTKKEDFASSGLTGHALRAAIAVPIVIVVIVGFLIWRRVTAKQQAQRQKVAPVPTAAKTSSNGGVTAATAKSTGPRPPNTRPPLAPAPAPNVTLQPLQPQGHRPQYPPMPMPQQQSVFSIPQTGMQQSYANPYATQSPFSNPAPFGGQPQLGSQLPFINPPSYGSHHQFGNQPYGPNEPPPSYRDPGYHPEELTHDKIEKKHKKRKQKRNDGNGYQPQRSSSPLSDDSDIDVNVPQRTMPQPNAPRPTSTMYTNRLSFGHIATVLTTPKPLKSSGTFGRKDGSSVSAQERLAMGRARLMWERAMVPPPATYISPQDWRIQQHVQQSSMRLHQERDGDLRRMADSLD